MPQPTTQQVATRHQRATRTMNGKTAHSPDTQSPNSFTPTTLNLRRRRRYCTSSDRTRHTPRQLSSDVPQPSPVRGERFHTIPPPPPRRLVVARARHCSATPGETPHVASARRGESADNGRPSSRGASSHLATVLPLPPERNAQEQSVSWPFFVSSSHVANGKNSYIRRKPEA